MNRFFAIDKKDNFLIFDQNAQKHFKVLRLENKEFVGVYDGVFYLCVYQDSKGNIIKTIDENRELPYEIILAPAIIKLDRFEWLIEKATELGVSKIVPIISQYCNQEIVKYKYERKKTRFEEIILNSAQQSFRNITPRLCDVQKFNEFIKTNADLKLIAHEKDNNLNIDKTNLKSQQKIILLVGPEGGFSDAEVLNAQQNGFKVVSLGKRILRAETASLYLLAQLGENNG